MNLQFDIDTLTTAAFLITGYFFGRYAERKNDGYWLVVTWIVLFVILSALFGMGII